MFSDLIGPLTHTRDGITTVYGIVHGPGSFPECAATAIFTKVSGPEILNWITEVSGKLAKVCLSNTRVRYSIKSYVFGVENFEFDTCGNVRGRTRGVGTRLGA